MAGLLAQWDYYNFPQSGHDKKHFMRVLSRSLSLCVCVCVYVEESHVIQVINDEIGFYDCPQRLEMHVVVRKSTLLE